MKTPDLKPCPCCGGKAKVSTVRPFFMIKKYHNRYVTAGCTQCGLCTSLFKANNKTGSPLRNAVHEEEAMREAADAWNRRANDEKVDS